jgi:hypothetical protein
VLPKARGPPCRHESHLSTTDRSAIPRATAWCRLTSRTLRTRRPQARDASRSRLPATILPPATPRSRRFGLVQRAISPAAHATHRVLCPTRAGDTLIVPGASIRVPGAAVAVPGADLPDVPAPHRLHARPARAPGRASASRVAGTRCARRLVQLAAFLALASTRRLAAT